MIVSGEVGIRDLTATGVQTCAVTTAAAHGAASVDAGGNWSYTVSDSGAVDALAAGEHLADSFTVKVADNHEIVTTHVCTLDTVRTHNPPATSREEQSGNVSEGDDLPAASMSASGQVTFFFF